MTLTTGTVTQLWRALLRDGEQRARIALPETHESYVVFALVRLSRDALLTGRTLALDLLEGLALDRAAQDDRLRHVGDSCLLVEGLFPGLAMRRGVGHGYYYTTLGQSAYGCLGERGRSAMAGLYGELAQAFRSLVMVLRSIRREQPAALMSQVLPDDVVRFDYYDAFDCGRPALRRVH
jgi:hypothetical protein